ncbi:MAG: hypothetical protein FWD52_06210 [Candidatus Bathyarchaeota archaeon]|nr:hypothetical protein [Candidatus Termiticorpusculum sp.]
MKKFALTLIFIFVLGLSLFEPSVAPVTMPTNSKAAPEVSVEIHNKPVWVPPTHNTNTYTGEVTELKPGYYTPNGSIVITIKNRPFTPYTDTNGNNITIYYSIFYSLYSWEYPCTAVYQSDTTYTILTFTYGSGNMKDMRTHVYVETEGKKIDFRIQAVTGYFKPGVSDSIFFHGYQVEPTYEGEGSKYTEFSITIPSADKPGTTKPNIQPPTNTPSPPNTDTPTTSDPYKLTPQNSMQSWLIIILTTMCIIIIPIAIVSYINKYQQRKTQSTNFGFVKNIYEET